MSPRRRNATSVHRMEELLTYHDALLRDRRRNRAFARALALHVRPGSRVLDLGAGSGVWAVLAAKLGARAVAVEREPLLAPVIRRMARDNGVADRVEVVTAEARRAPLRRHFDVVVSETVGNQGFDESIVELMSLARERFLRRGGVLIPSEVSLVAAPVAWAPGQPPVRPVRCTSFEEVLRHVGRGVLPGTLVRLAPGATLLKVDLTVARPLRAMDLEGGWRVRDGRRVAGIAIWVRARLAPGVSLSTFEGTHWTPTLLPVEPLPAGPGRLRLQLALPLKHWRWRWEIEWRAPSGSTVNSTLSPLFAYGSLRADTRGSVRGVTPEGNGAR